MVTQMRRLFPLWLTLLACEPPPEADPARAQIITEDLPRFWASFDQGTDAATFERGYLAPGSSHLRSFLQSRIGSAERLAETVTRNRAYASIRENTLSVVTPAWREELAAVFAKAKEFDPAAVFPPTALLVGRMNSGGTTSASGILIGLELYSLAPDSPHDTLDAFERVAVQSNENLLALIAHEHVHTQQDFFGARPTTTLLEKCLREGIADYVGEKTAGKVINPAMYEWARVHEAALWSEFRAEMNGTDHSRWLYNQGKDPNRPGDLGYFIGYRIAAAWAKRQGTEGEAVRALLRVDDAARVLAESGYAGSP